MGISHHSRCGGQPVAVGVFGELPAGGEPLVVSAAGTAKPWLRLVDGGVVVPPVEDRPHHSVGLAYRRALEPPGLGRKLTDHTPSWRWLTMVPSCRSPSNFRPSPPTGMATTRWASSRS